MCKNIYFCHIHNDLEVIPYKLAVFLAFFSKFPCVFITSCHLYTASSALSASEVADIKSKRAYSIKTTF